MAAEARTTQLSAPAVQSASMASAAAGLHDTANTTDSQVYQVRDGAIQDLLRFYADKGDVQTCVTVMIALGPLGQTLFSSRQRKQWLTGYIGTHGHGSAGV